MCSAPVSLRRLQVVADSDPNALARVLERFQNSNVLPRRVSAEVGTNDILHIQVDVCGLSEAQSASIVAQVRRAPCIVNAFWHRM